MDLVLAVAALLVMVLLALAGWLSCCESTERADADPIGPVHLAPRERRAVADLERLLRQD
jgi:hypothetical protein